MALKLQPGAKYPAHHHVGVEQCLTLEGSARPGQLGFASAGTDHAVVESDGGCLMLLISNQDDEVFA